MCIMSSRHSWQKVGRKLVFAACASTLPHGGGWGGVPEHAVPCLVRLGGGGGRGRGLQKCDYIMRALARGFGIWPSPSCPASNARRRPWTKQKSRQLGSRLHSSQKSLKERLKASARPAKWSKLTETIVRSTPKERRVILTRPTLRNR